MEVEGQIKRLSVRVHVILYSTHSPRTRRSRRTPGSRTHASGTDTSATRHMQYEMSHVVGLSARAFSKNWQLNCSMCRRGALRQGSSHKVAARCVQNRHHIATLHVRNGNMIRTRRKRGSRRAIGVMATSVQIVTQFKRRSASRTPAPWHRRASSFLGLERTTKSDGSA